jgi:hypothetical protein
MKKFEKTDMNWKIGMIEPMWELPPAVVYSFMAPPVKKGDCQFCLHSHEMYDNPCWKRFFDKDKPCWEPKKRISKDTVVFTLVAIIVIAIVMLVVWQLPKIMCRFLGI